MAQILDQQKLATYLVGARWEDNPVPEPERHMRPNEIYKVQFSDTEDNDPEVVTEEEFAKLFDE